MSVHCPSCPLQGTIRNSALFGEHVCPVECTVKLLLFLSIFTMILYIPLGRFTHYGQDCPLKTRLLTVWDDNSSVVCCLCDLYKTILYIGHAFAETWDQSLSFVLNFLYEGKLQFYRLLGSLDNRDLCRSVCCEVCYSGKHKNEIFATDVPNARRLNTGRNENSAAVLD